jgi:hypothetical protein
MKGMKKAARRNYHALPVKTDPQIDDYTRRRGTPPRNGHTWMRGWTEDHDFHQRPPENIPRKESSWYRQEGRKDPLEQSRWGGDQHYYQHRAEDNLRSEEPLYRREERERPYYAAREQRAEVRREYSDLKNYFPEQLRHHSDKPEYKITDQIQKWGCHFNSENAIESLERTEELRKAYGFVGAQLLRGLLELLRGEGLQWFRSITPPKTWTEFKERVRNIYLSGPMSRHLFP